MSSGKNMSAYLDRKVVTFFIVVFILAAGSFSFRYANYETCGEVSFSLDIKEPTAGNMVQFKGYSEGAKEWEWDFGDGTAKKGLKDQLHVFNMEGDYIVRLLVNNKCERIETVHVKPEIIVIDSTKFPVFSLPKSIKVGQRLIVTDSTENASSWEWRFGETANVNAATKTAEYIYEEPGLKTVSLLVNGDINFISKKKINVIPLKGSQKRISEITKKSRDDKLGIKSAPSGDPIKPAGQNNPTPISEPEPEPTLTNQNIKTKIMMIAKGQMTPKSISEFFCGDANPLIVVNDRSFTYNTFCRDIKGINIVIENLQITWGDNRKCIGAFNIKYKTVANK